MTKTMAKVQPVPVLSAEMTDIAERSQFFATLWLVILGSVFGVSLFCTAVLLAWPLVAEYAAKLN